MGWLASLRERARRLKSDVLVLYIAARDRRTPLVVKLLVVAIVAYVVSPIDLIPDFIPVLGYLDELILVPFVLGLAMRLVPGAVLEEARAKAPAAWDRAKRLGWWGGAFIVLVWIALAVFLYYAFRGLVGEAL